MEALEGRTGRSISIAIGSSGFFRLPFLWKRMAFFGGGFFTSLKPVYNTLAAVIGFCSFHDCGYDFRDTGCNFCPSATGSDDLTVASRWPKEIWTRKFPFLPRRLVGWQQFNIMAARVKNEQR